jgi:hypothetical protein
VEKQALPDERSKKAFDPKKSLHLSWARASDVRHMWSVGYLLDRPTCTRTTTSHALSTLPRRYQPTLTMLTSKL